jgi:hypothetical protein
MILSASLIFYASLLLAMVTVKLGHEAPVFFAVTAGLMGLAYRYLQTPGWPASGELSAASIVAIVVLASLPNALGLA